MNGIEIYKTQNGETAIEVKFEQETVWLSQQQMAELFEQTKQNISLHINNCYKEGELEKTATVKEYLTVQNEGNREVKRRIEYYNLDVVISVGYRVKSKRGTQFRQWATQRLNDYLVKGQAINQKRLEELGKMVQLIERQGKTEGLQFIDAKGLLDILSNYTRSFVLLNQFDSHTLGTSSLNETITYEIQYPEALAAIAELKKQLIEKKEATELFGNEKDDGFKSSLQSIVQTFGGQYLYPSIEEQAANLLYFVIKNHSFSDGNKRIGAFLFIWFLEKNKHHLKKSGELKINDNGLTALALLVAQSDPAEKEMLVKLIMNLVNSPEP
ncbi:virulence protein RhuM/Fic/DOC family protein [Haliscomenobacter hydrossis]|uniref:Death-on-curing family protein n=1 Tax=Haliscomenobacter hydrossis (strain ATCC 27775 / DSM 1100 / LMG 10767 / O) TaxID=760192 RepID=F4L3S1_HALH1|nr:virulence protein RhuM/Fic/DOC family protein [Haliscomenobacter hydrossis]AEE48675.1 death-on-curing family protein [Haliscomenobacter hydrossis DSM 1100]